MDKITSLDIQPQAGVLGVFSRLNYKPWYAIAEFVDNSTQSFYNHELELAQNAINSVTVKVKYDFKTNILTITDDAYGMEMDDFSRAVKVDSPPESSVGRNEFGMGLKTAASWFGNIWSVESTQYGSSTKYYTEVNITELRTKHLNSIQVVAKECDANEHGTTIIIKDITKKIDAGRTRGKIVKLLQSMYRRDLNSGKVNVWFNDSPLHFEEYACLKFRDKTWRKDLEFVFEFDGHSHVVRGFVGILASGGFGKAGFALFRRGRVVVGGEDQNYKPEGIFHQAQSPISHKLFGELDLDDFPVNQAKDGFVWDDGLEIAFVDSLRAQIKDYIDIARMTKKERVKEEEFSPQSSDKVHDEVQSFANAISAGASKDVEDIPFQEDFFGSEEESSKDEIDSYKDYIDESNNCGIKKVGGRRSYPININEVVSKKFVVEWAIGNKEYWINIEDSEDEQSINIVININHPFFKPYSNDEDFKIVLEKFVISFVVAEQQAILTADKEGYIRAATIRNKMNEFLSKVSEV